MLDFLSPLYLYAKAYAIAIFVVEKALVTQQGVDRASSADEESPRHGSARRKQALFDVE